VNPRGNILVYRDIALYESLTSACRDDRSEWHVHLRPEPEGVWVSIDVPDDPRHGSSLGWSPRFVKLRDWWWHRTWGSGRTLEERVASAVDDALRRIRWHEGKSWPTTPSQELGRAAARAAVDQVIERWGRR
jgi:hypothetical protein